MTLEVDGRRWRTVSDDVVVRVGLAAGMRLDGPVLRRLRDEVRRSEAMSVAARALARRDVSRRRLVERLDRAGVGGEIADAALVRLAEAGLVDDARLAERRAAVLSQRGWGDVAIAARLEGEGLDETLVRETVQALPPESERARALVAGEPDRRKRARRLAQRGFTPATVEDVLGALDEDGASGLG